VYVTNSGRNHANLYIIINWKSEVQQHVDNVWCSIPVCTTTH